MRIIAMEDIGRTMTAAFADPERFDRAAFEFADDRPTATDVGASFTGTAGRPVAPAAGNPRFGIQPSLSPAR